MKIISTNIGQPTAIIWNGKKQTTGIYKYPTVHHIQLEKESVAHDTIADRKVHGGPYKACYLFSADQYPYWKEMYPDLEWNWGMFGENLTVENLDETAIRIGDVYRIGEAVVQVTQPREPCYKLGIRFGDQKILKQFIAHGYPGTYVRIIEEGEVKVGDTVDLITRSSSSLTTKQFFDLLFSKKKNVTLIEMAVANEALPQKKRQRLQKFL
ncbi:MOSC domain-containing protein [Allomuricauda sp. SCSIO 65647]|uniref:MOSC domain-containing protein n=1 Tax=Allomuricauda sp. SCSIO 65647 TaxID=2908843 RepID=UPI001F3608E7|nr:MOSC domain-containing protein [Muricauda sp. SCSIO 65647]UJH68024.1 MOSC domain-containing protein [Muricauda sp. SCSIO 65647]